MTLSVAPHWWNGKKPGDGPADSAGAASDVPCAAGGPPHPARASLRGLDWFVFFVANVQTGFGPFISVYLTSRAWTQVDIGIVLSIGSLV